MNPRDQHDSTAWYYCYAESFQNTAEISQSSFTFIVTFVPLPHHPVTDSNHGFLTMPVISLAVFLSLVFYFLSVVLLF